MQVTIKKSKQDELVARIMYNMHNNVLYNPR